MTEGYILVSKYSVSLFLIIALFLVGMNQISIHNLKKSDSEVFKKIQLTDSQIQISLDSLMLKLEKYNKGISDSMVAADYAILSSQLIDCRKKIDTQKTNMEAELDNELNKITIWLTIMALVFGLLNIGMSIGNQISASHEVDRITDKVDSKHIVIEGCIAKLEDDFNKIQCEFKALWDLSDFDFRTSIRGFRKTPDLTRLKEVLDNLLMICTARHNNNDLSKIKMFVERVYEVLFSDYKYMKVNYSHATLKLLEDLQYSMSSFKGQSSADSFDKLILSLTKTINEIEPKA